jgi:hypothetical protein
LEGWRMHFPHRSEGNNRSANRVRCWHWARWVRPPTEEDLCRWPTRTTTASSSKAADDHSKIPVNSSSRAAKAVKAVATTTTTTTATIKAGAERTAEPGLQGAADNRALTKNRWIKVERPPSRGRFLFAAEGAYVGRLDEEHRP